MLSSDKIILRAIEENDLDLLASWRNNPEAYDYFYEYLPLSKKHQRNWYESQFNNLNEINWIIATPQGTPIGTVSIYNIDRRNRKAEWGRFMICDKNFIGQGLGKLTIYLVMQYAFEHLNLHKLYCEVFQYNIKALSLYKKLGFMEDGILRDHIFKQGKYVNVLTLSILDSEYFSNKLENLFKDMVKD